MPQGPVTIFISRRFKPGTEAAVAQWIKEVRECSATFPGFLGGVTFEPHRNQSGNCHIAFRYASFAYLQRWEESPEREVLYERLQPMLEEEQASRFSGFEPWFPADGITQPSPPPKWKMALMALMAVYPCVILVHCTVGLFLGDLPFALSILISCIPVSFLMSYLAMPFLTRSFQKWLYPSAVLSPQKTA